MGKQKADKRADIWMPLYVADYLADTVHLSTEEHGAYLLLLMYAWTNGGELPGQDDRLRRITRMDSEAWSASGEELKSFFYLDPETGVYRHHRIDTEIAKALNNVEQRSKAGKASAAKRAAERAAQQNGNGNSTDVATGDATNVPTDSSTEGSTEPQHNSKPSPSPTPTTEPNGSFVSDTRTGIPVPDDLTPDRKDFGTAQTLSLDISLELERFKAHYAARSELRQDVTAWQNQFRKWLLDQHQFNAERNRVTDAKVKAVAAGSQSRQDSVQAAARALGVGSQYLTAGDDYAAIPN